MKKKSHGFSHWNVRFRKIRGTIFPLVLRLAAPLVFIRRRLWPHKISLYRVEGTVNGGMEPLSLLCSAVKQHKNYLLGLAFGGERRETDLGQVRLRDVFRRPRSFAKDSSLVILETKQHLHTWLDDGSWFFIPIWVSGKVSLPVPETILRHDSIKTTYRKIHKHGFEYEVTADEKRFKDFFNNMYVPFTIKAHGDTAFLDTYEERRSQMESFEVVLLRKRAQPDLFISGFLIVYEPAGPRLWFVGVRDGNMDYLREGVLAALYIFCFEYLQQKGFTHVNLGGSRPFLHDGVLTFKRKHSQTVTYARWEGFALKILFLTPAAKVFLMNNPFIFESRGTLCGAVFVEDASSPEILRRIFKKDFHPGLAKLVVYSFAGVATAGPDPIPPELAGQIEVRSASELLTAPPHLP